MSDKKKLEPGSVISKRYDFVLLFDVADGNPNGDPDAGNLPRTDPQTGHGLVTDVCLKRKVRNFVLVKHGGVAPYDIFVKEKAVLNSVIEERVKEEEIELKDGKTFGDGTDRARIRMCDEFFDVRTFGAVMSTGVNAGQVRGPVQLTFGRSVNPIVHAEHSITRMAVATVEEAEEQAGDNRTMGRKATVSYGLYRAHGFVSPSQARRDGSRRVKGTGFGENDLALLWEALEHMFDQDHSAARGTMGTRALVVFEHEDGGHGMGVAQAHQLFDLVTVKKRAGVDVPTGFGDYELRVSGVEFEAESLGSVKTTRVVKRDAKGAVTVG
ncbi:MAG: type I-C CRISPR-associated protein Cas7/Csd2 [Deltaproteobacteria bacterium]|nr:type I-C CRISPR-associated protein Cas7/Csd2 [Deltaproteobacteria bacterium]